MKLSRSIGWDRTGFFSVNVVKLHSGAALGGREHRLFAGDLLNRLHCVFARLLVFTIISRISVETVYIDQPTYCISEARVSLWPRDCAPTEVTDSNYQAISARILWRRSNVVFLVLMKPHW